MKNDHRKKIAKCMKLIWSSLESHLDDTHHPVIDTLKEQRAKNFIGGARFHRKCVREYAYIIRVLSELL